MLSVRRAVITQVLAAVVFLLAACGTAPATNIAATANAASSTGVLAQVTPAGATSAVTVAPATSQATAATTSAVTSEPATSSDLATATSTTDSLSTAATLQSASSTTAVAAPTPTVAATPVPQGPKVVPVKLTIAAINVSAPVELVGLTPDGAMDVPKKWEDVGWYEYGPTPGQPGNAAVAGHLDSTTAPAVFWRLNAVNPGDKITVTLSDQQTVTFVVTQRASYAYNDAPMTRIFGPATTANLNLITCGGNWDSQTKNYSNRIVIYATKQ